MNNKTTDKFGLLGIILVLISIIISLMNTADLGMVNFFLRFIFTIGSTWFFIWTGKTLSHILGMTYNYEMAVIVSSIAFLVGVSCEIICGVYIDHAFNSCTIIALGLAVAIYLKTLHIKIDTK